MLLRWHNDVQALVGFRAQNLAAVVCVARPNAAPVCFVMA